ncbi:MAG: TIGR00282 family metallophosphoesterase [Termitinemataceae bacterium]|nr:MAG: TIGR00282 family metallophosphoesterase [Termitinemataceae bacterium]
MRVLYVAEIVGKAGVFTFKKAIALVKAELKPDFVIACADGATGAKGLGKEHALYIKKLGANVLSCGDFCFAKKDLTEDLERLPFILRPANLNGDVPGFGYGVFKCTDKKIAVAVLLGQAEFSRFHSENPIAGLKGLLENLRSQTPFVIVDYHAAASAEKQTLFYAADGLCSAVIGSHCRVQTADETVLHNGTAVITDAGRTGSQLSVGGCEAKSCIAEFITGIPHWKKDAWDCLELQGVLIDIDDCGKAVSITRVRKAVSV